MYPSLPAAEPFGYEVEIDAPGEVENLLLQHLEIVRSKTSERMSPETLERISRFTVDTFASVVRKLENPVLRPLLRMALPQMYAYLPSLKHLRDEYARGNDLILRGATALLLIHTPQDMFNPVSLDVSCLDLTPVRAVLYQVHLLNQLHGLLVKGQES